jgi:phenylacetate-CoA ligase
MHSRLAGSARLAAGLLAQRRFAFRPVEAIARAQARRVRAMVTHAWRTVPFYREAMGRLGLTPADFRTSGDLARLPVIERSDLQRDPERFRSSAFAARDLLHLRSSGCTGEPVAVWHDLGAVIANAAHGERDRSVWAGPLAPRTGYREAVLGLIEGADASVQRFLRRGVVLPSRADIERRYLSGLAPVPDTLAALNAFRPQVVHGYGSMLELLFAHVASARPPFERPVVVTYSSDELDTATRAFVESELGIPVFATYEAIEAFKIGFECGRGTGYHLNVDLYPLRVDEGGEVIVSNLVNRATVLFNYRIGDRAELSREACPCGRSLPLMSRLDGRRDGVLVRDDGSDVLPMAIAVIFARAAGVRQFQVHEVERLRLVVRLVVDPSCERRAVEASIVPQLAATIGTHARVEVEYVDRIERTPGGKVQRIRAYHGGR